MDHLLLRVCEGNMSVSYAGSSSSRKATSKNIDKSRKWNVGIQKTAKVSKVFCSKKQKLIVRTVFKEKMLVKLVKSLAVKYAHLV